MIIGAGMMARSFLKYDFDEILVFASGVSNSKTTDDFEFFREISLLESLVSKHLNKTLIYFSSCSLGNNILNRDAYHLHKLYIENWISENIPKYIIFRLPNVVGPQSNNTNTLLPFLIKNIKNGLLIQVWSGAVRNIIDVEHVAIIVNYIIEHNLYLNCVVNIANSENIIISELIKILEIHLGMRAKIDFIKTPDENFSIDISQIEQIAKESGILFGSNYVLEVLKKYY